jgi:hypothetical protein
MSPGLPMLGEFITENRLFSVINWVEEFPADMAVAPNLLVARTVPCSPGRAAGAGWALRQRILCDKRGREAAGWPGPRHAAEQ